MRRESQHVSAATAGFWICALLTCQPLQAGEIHDAIRINDLKTVKALVADDPNTVESRGENRVTPLHEAVRYGDAEMVEFLIAHGADLQAKCYNEFTPLHLTHDPEIARILIRNGADPKARSSMGTVLDHAVQDEDLELIGVLLEAGATLAFEQLVELGYTDRVAAMLKEQPWLAKAPRKPLHAAAGNGHLEMVRLLLDNGADPNLDFGFSNVPGTYSPFSSAMLAGHYEVAKLLCERGADMDVSGGKFYDNLFHEVVATRELRFAQLMLEHGADVNSQKHDWGAMTPLHVAANIGDVEKCKLLIQHTADVNARTPDGAAPLTFAIAWRHDAICDLLLSQGALLDIHSASALGKTAEVRAMLEGNPSLANDRDRRLRRTPLFWAAGHGHLPTVELLIEYKADVNARAPRYSQAGNVVTGPQVWHDADEKPEAGETPLHVAADAGQTAVVRVLLERGAKIDAPDAEQEVPLQRAIENKHLETVKLLLEKGALAGNSKESGPLLSSAYDSPEITELLLSAHPPPGALDEALRGAAGRNTKVADLLLAHGAVADIYAACILGQVDRVAELVGADRSLVDKPQPEYPRQRPLVLAAENGHAKVVELLLDQGATIEPKRGDSPLEAAAGAGRLDVVQLLLARGADINQKDSMGRTPLESAASGGHHAAVKLLIERGAPVLARDVYHATALHAAARQGNVDIARTLIDVGIPVDCRNEFRETPLHEAASQGHAEMAAFLLKAGADVNAKNRRGKTPLFYAERTYQRMFRDLEKDRTAVAALLRERGGVK